MTQPRSRIFTSQCPGPSAVKIGFSGHAFQFTSSGGKSLVAESGEAAWVFTAALGGVFVAVAGWPTATCESISASPTIAIARELLTRAREYKVTIPIRAYFRFVSSIS